MKKEDEKPKDVPINPNRVAKGAAGVRYKVNLKELPDDFAFGGRHKTKKQLYQEQSGSGCMVALLLMIIPSILLSLLLF